MCNLQTHMDRDHRVEEAKRAEPVYAALAAEHGIGYESPTAATPAQAERARAAMAAFQDALGDYYDAGMIGDPPKRPMADN